LLKNLLIFFKKKTLGEPLRGLAPARVGLSAPSLAPFHFASGSATIPLAIRSFGANAPKLRARFAGKTKNRHKSALYICFVAKKHKTKIHLH
jgi:hypothetical protein